MLNDGYKVNTRKLRLIKRPKTDYVPVTTPHVRRYLIPKTDKPCNFTDSPNVYSCDCVFFLVEKCNMLLRVIVINIYYSFRFVLL